MELVNNQQLRLRPGPYTIKTSMSSGSSKLQMKDANESGDSFQDVDDTSKSASATYNIDIAGDVVVKCVLTGDADFFLINRN